MWVFSKRLAYSFFFLSDDLIMIYMQKKEHAASSAASEFSKVFMAEFLCVDSFDLILPSIS